MNARIAAVKSRWLGREDQIDRLLRVLGPCDAPVPPVFIGGLPSCGKTAVVRDLFQTLDLPHAYVNCIESSTQRLVFETAINQLHRHVPTVGNSFAAFSKCSDVSQFISLIAEAAFPSSAAHTAAATSLSPTNTADDTSQAIALQHAARIERASGSAWMAEETQYIIVDSAERLIQMDKMLLTALVRLDELTARNICCIFVSHVPYEHLAGVAATRAMVRVDVPPYSKSQLTDILCLACQDAAHVYVDAYKEMVKLILTAVLEQYREVMELQQVAAAAWPLVKAALDAPHMPPAGSELTAVSSSSSGGSDTAIIKPLQIYRLIKPVLRQAAARSLCLPGALPGLEPAKCSSSGSGSGSGRQLDAELPFYSKHLLIAAFLASYNPPSRDVATFSLTSTGVMKKRRRGGSQGPATAKAKLAKGGAGVATKASANALLQAPQPFGLERLLAIFYTLGTQLY